MQKELADGDLDDTGVAYFLKCYDAPPDAVQTRPPRRWNLAVPLSRCLGI